MIRYLQVVARKNSIGVPRQYIGTHGAIRPGQDRSAPTHLHKFHRPQYAFAIAPMQPKTSDFGKMQKFYLTLPIYNELVLYHLGIN